MNDCIFCKIINGDIPSNKEYEDENVIVIHDLNPLADTHLLVIPKKHISCADEINESNSDVVAHVFEAVSKVTKKLGIENNFQVLNNCGENAGQSVMHIHFHIMSNKEGRVLWSTTELK